MYSGTQKINRTGISSCGVVGPSGSGKTHLVRQVAQSLNADLLHVTVSEWVLIGASARGVMTTWTIIYNLLKKNLGGGYIVIFIDEIDKIAKLTGSWDAYLRAEIYGVLDFKLPAGIQSLDGGMPSPMDLIRAQQVLINRTLIVGAGAFQHIWDVRSKPSVGFGTKTEDLPKTADLGILSATLPRELVNRFRSDIVVLPDLRENDYLGMLQKMGAEMPADLRKTFLKLGIPRVGEAVRLKQGCRFLEEVFMDTLVIERGTGNPVHQEALFETDFEIHPDDMP